jgi:hypothetical protein
VLRRSYRDGKHVRNETLGNLTHLGPEKVEQVRRTLRGREAGQYRRRLQQRLKRFAQRAHTVEAKRHVIHRFRMWRAFRRTQ